ncbi:hypothetical protein BDC45DRAFT_332626 [Circinella umbellata]|nr:hypothetical protein BDC45DRAFT_332626 [Circinella umbellata]
MARSETRQQKRKRDEPLTEKTSLPEEEQGVSTSLPPAKKIKAESSKKLGKEASAREMDEKMDVDESSIEEIHVWIGASSLTNKVGLYYGTITDARNWIGVPELEPELYSLKDACVWAAIQAVERCNNDTKPVFIYTDCQGLCTNENRNSLREKLNEMISRRSGSTVILHTLATTSSQLQEAQEYVVVKQQDNNGAKEVVQKEESKENKSVYNSDGLEKDTNSLKIGASTEEVQQKSGDEDHDGIAKDSLDAPASSDTVAPSGSSWKPTGGLARNLLDILMSPFTRKTRTH